MRIKTLPKQLKNVLICIDSANVAIGLRNHGLALDYRKFVGAIQKHGKKIKIYYYGPKFPHESHQRFLAFLKQLGCKLRTKEVKLIRDQLGDHRKANFDVELAIDFVALVRYLHHKKKKTYVLSTRGSIAKELVDESDGYVVLSEWNAVVRPYRKKSPR